MKFARKGNLIALAVLSSAFMSQAYAGAFQLFEQNAVVLGNFGAGAAAYAEDASTAYYNSAGLVMIKHPQVVASLDDILLNVKFQGTNVWSTPATFPLISSYSQNGTAQAGGQNFVPAFHFATPLTERLYFGFSIAAPFGLVTDYPETSFLRYSATKTSLKVIDFSPSIGFALTDCLSIGGGIDPEYAAAEFDSITGTPAILPNPTSEDSSSTNKGHSFNTLGWHAGALLHMNNDQTRIGVNYRSRTTLDLHGYSLLSGPVASTVPGQSGQIYSGDLSANLELPATTEFSAYQAITSRLALLGSIIYTQWSVLQNINLNNVAALNAITGLPFQADLAVPQDYRNTWRFALGAEYACTDNFLVRVGGGYDQTPTTNQYRGPRLPDGNRYALALGGHYQWSRQVGFDFGYTHLFVRNGNVNFSTSVPNNNAATATIIPVLFTSQAIGTSTNSADMFGAQLNYSFV